MNLCFKRPLLGENQRAEMFNLMFKNATPEQWADWLRAPLEHAAARGNAELVATLIKSGANGSSAGPKGCGGRTLIDAAVEGDNADVMFELLRAGSGPDVNENPGRKSPLYASIYGGHLSAAKALLAAGANVNHFDGQDLCSPLHAAVFQEDEDIVMDLLIGGADPNARAAPSQSGRTPLIFAVESGNEKVVSALLCSPNTNKDALDVAGFSSLMVACQKGYASIAATLVSAGASIHVRQGSSRFSALDFAAQAGHVDVIVAVLQRFPHAGRHAKMLGIYTPLRTPLHTASYYNQPGSLIALLENGFDVNARGERLCTSLHVAVEGSCVGTFLVLLRRGADVHAADADGNTALHHACDLKMRGVDIFVDLLLRWGATETLVNFSGRSAADMIQEPDLSADWPESQEEQERARALIARAPADRVWRRRCWLVMLHARAEKAKIPPVAHSNSGDAGRNGGSRLKMRRADDGNGGSAVDGEGRRTVEDSNTAAATESFGGLVTALIGLRPQGVFRAVVGFV